MSHSSAPKMGTAYSDDLRRKLWRRTRKEGSLTELADDATPKGDTIPVDVVPILTAASPSRLPVRRSYRLSRQCCCKSEKEE